jgi:hypothetical protein
LGERLTSLAEDRAQAIDSRATFASVSDPASLTESLAARARLADEIEGRMRAVQEELDWFWYGALGLAGRLVDATASIAPGERASDVLFAKAVLKGGVGNRYFQLCRLPSAAQVVRMHSENLASKVDLVERTPELRLIESPTYKRTYREGFRRPNASEAAVDFVLDRAETRFSAAPTPERATSLLRHVEASPASAATLAWLLTVDTARSLRELLRERSVPFLAAYRYSESGLEKHAEWERVWNLQRAEDRGERPAAFDPPPKYDQADYRDILYWHLRGKLDVPKERFISYPGCESDEDAEHVYGWAGWNHLQQAIALATLYLKRKQGEAWGKDRLVPMLAGLEELLPWIWQWHPDVTAESGGMKPGQYIADFVSAQCQELGVTLDELRAWRPDTLKKDGKAARAVADDEELVRPSLTAQEESLLLILALAHLRPSNRVALARAFALLHQPTALKKLVPSRLRDRAAHWARAVKGRTAAVGMFRTALDYWLADGKLVDQAGTIRVKESAPLEGLQSWWAMEAELAFTAADALTEETLEKLVSKVPTVDRAELREIA